MSVGLWTRWLAAALAVMGVAALCGYVASRGDLAALETGWLRGVLVALGLFSLGWCVRGIVLTSGGEAGRAAKTAQVFFQTLALAVSVAMIGMGVMGERWITGGRLAWALGSLWVLGWVFAGAIGAVRGALSLGGATMAAAKAVVDEAVRMKVAVVFMALLLLMLPTLPLVLGEDQPVRYRVQSFLSYSLSATGFLLSMMTIFLACATLSWEIENKQIFTVATKPVSRVRYLLGKWLGIAALNAVLVTVSAVTIYGFTALYLAQLPPKDEYDRRALYGQVLTARASSEARPAEGMEQRVARRVEEMVREDPRAVEELGRMELEESGGAAGAAALTEAGIKRAKRQFEEQYRVQALSIGPNRTETYVFDGLGRARELGTPVQLQYRMRTAIMLEGAQEFPMRVSINGRERLVKLVPSALQVIPIDASLISDEGRLEVSMTNPDARNTVVFFVDEGLRVLYKVGEFGPNFARAAAVMWIKLAFVGMLGLAAATFLGFPVACVLSLLVYFTALGAPYLFEAIGDVSSIDPSAIGYVDLAGRYIAWYFTKVFAAFSHYNASGKVVDGELVSWGSMAGAAVWIGVVWTAAAGAIGAAVFRGRELARVQV